MAYPYYRGPVVIWVLNSARHSNRSWTVNLHTILKQLQMFIQKLKNILPQLLLLVISTVLSLAALEVALRVFNIPPKPVIPENCQQFTQEATDAHDYADVHAAYPPNSTHTLCTSEFQVTYNFDANGYLGYAKSDVKPQSLLVLGDSFAFGFGVEPAQSFAGRLGAYDAGLWGISFPTHAEAFKQIVDVVKPRQVIWTIYPWHLISLSDGGWRARVRFDENAHPFLSQVVDFYNQTNLSSVILTATGWGVNRFDFYTLEYALYDEQDTSMKMAYWEFEKAVKKITRLAKERNIQLIPVFIPSKSRLALDVDGRRPPLLHFGHILQGDLPTRRMSEILVRYGIPVEDQIDAFELFKDGSVDWHESYFVIDGHLNVQGNKYLADFLKRKLDSIK